MSYIDSYDHVLVGYMAGLPLYRPLEDIPGPENGESRLDFPCRTDQLVLGGGTCRTLFTTAPRQPRFERKMTKRVVFSHR